MKYMFYLPGRACIESCRIDSDGKLHGRTITPRRYLYKGAEPEDYCVCNVKDYSEHVPTEQIVNGVVYKLVVKDGLLRSVRFCEHMMDEYNIALEGQRVNEAELEDTEQ